MNLRAAVEIYAKAEKRNVLDPIKIGSPAPSIDGPAKEPENWQELGEEDVEKVLEHNFQRHYVDPKDWRR